MLVALLTAAIPLIAEAPRAYAGAPPSQQGTLDPGPVERGANAVLLVSCDRGAMEIYLDG